jgi:hypothetical protein
MECACYFTLAAILLTGCQTKNEMFEEEPIKANLRQISKAYWAHLGYHQKPPSPEDLRGDVQGLHALEMGRPADEAMVSPRDKQPLVIVYGANLSTPTDAILAYEKEGVDGKRYVVTMRQEIKEVTEEEFAKATFPRGHKPDRN